MNFRKLVFTDRVNLILFSVFLLSFFLLIGSFIMTGGIVSIDTLSNVSVSKYLAINFGGNLSEGIQFGNVVFLPATNVNATHNYDGAFNGTTYTIDVSNDSNSDVDFCIKANAGLTSSAMDVIGLSNETYSAYLMTNLTHPLLSNETPLTTSYIKAQSDIGIGNSSYWRFWLDIPSSQPAGDYNNTVSFQAVNVGNLC
jgi:hypothetical protein